MTKKLLGTFTRHGVTVTYDGLTKNGRSTPIVTCPICRKKRRVDSRYAAALRGGGVTGRCHVCNSKMIGQAISRATSGKYQRIDDQALSSGSVIHWGIRDPNDHRRVSVTCGMCKKTRFVQISTSLTAPGISGWCRRCANVVTARKGSEHHMWKGGRTTDTDGYVWLLARFLDEEDRQLAMPMINHAKYVLEHRLVMARKMGRSLSRQEVVHHLNGIKDDNRVGNLEIVSPAKHTEKHMAIRERLRAEILRLQNILSLHGIAF